MLLLQQRLQHRDYPGYKALFKQPGERAAVLMTFIESVKLNGHDAWAYLKDVLTQLPTWPNSRLQELLPHRCWVPPETAATPPIAPLNT